jgi:hypothetical protein
VTDKGFEGENRHQQWAEAYGAVVVCASKRSTKKRRWPKAFRRWVVSIRQIVETVRQRRAARRSRAGEAFRGAGASQPCRAGARVGSGLSAHRAQGGTSTTGMGLGLELCRTLITRAGGTLEVECDGPDGTCFRLQLPARLPRGSEDAAGASLTGRASRSQLAIHS